MPRLSAFTPLGQLRMSSAPSYIQNWYVLLQQLWGRHLDFTQVGSYDEEKLYAVARMLAMGQAEFEHASNQLNPLKCYDLLPLQELDYQLIPGPKDDYVARQNALAAAMLMSRGALASNIVNLLKAMLGTNFLAYIPNPAGTPTVYPANPGNGPGAFKDVRIPTKFLKLVDPVASIGTQWVAYQALDTSAVPSTTWSASGTFSVGQAITPTLVGSNGFYFLCSTAGTSGTTEPSWPNQVGSTIADGTAVWTCGAQLAPALVVGDVVVMDPGNTNRMEKVSVLQVANTPPVGSISTPGFLYFQGTFTLSHDIGSPITTGIIPYWWSTQLLQYIVVKATAAIDPPTRAKVDKLMGIILRGPSTWAIVQPTTTTMTGGTVGPTSAGLPMGAVPIGSFSFVNSN